LKRLSFLASLLIAVAPSPPARAQSLLSGDEQNVVNFAFATQLGSGIYAARSLRRGLWSDPDWTAPWDWRMARKDALFFATDHSNASMAGCMRELREAPPSTTR